MEHFIRRAHKRKAFHLEKNKNKKRKGGKKQTKKGSQLPDVCTKTCSPQRPGNFAAFLCSEKNDQKTLTLQNTYNSYFAHVFRDGTPSSRGRLRAVLVWVWGCREYTRNVRKCWILDSDWSAALTVVRLRWRGFIRVGALVIAAIETARSQGLVRYVNVFIF